MTTELRRLDHQLRTTFAGEAWHGPAVLELLADVTPEQAMARPIPGAHTIWELVLHLAGTYRLVLRRLRADSRPISPEEDWPTEAVGSADRWREAVAALTELNAELRQALGAFPAAHLDDPLVPEPPYSAYVQFIGLTQHDLYHAGQIVLLKRSLAQGAREEPPVSGHATVELLRRFLDAFNRHDLDAIMSYFADDCVFYMPRGTGPRGDRYGGKAEVRAGLAKRFEGLPDVHYGDDRHWVCGDLGVSEWTLTGTMLTGQRVEVRGVDLLEFAGGKIIRKDSFWKIIE